MIKVASFPIECAWCRTDIPGRTSEIPDSSGICQECIDKHFPDLKVVLSPDNADIGGVPTPKVQPRD